MPYLAFFRRPVVLPLLVFVLALGVRLYYVNVVPQVPVRFDAQDYLVLARDIAQSPNWRDDVALWQKHIATFEISFGYPLLLSGIIRLLGEESIRNVQAVMGGFTALFICLITTRLSNRRVGLLAGACFALYPTMITYSGLLLTEASALFVLWASVYTFVEAIYRRSVTLMMIATCLSVVAFVLRVSLLPFLPLFVVAVFVSWRGGWVQRILVVASVLGLIASGYLFYNRVLKMPPDPALIRNVDALKLTQEAFYYSHHPLLQGWSEDRKQVDMGDYLTNPAHMAVSLSNHLFFGVWYADTTYLASWAMPIPQMHALQGLLLLLTLVGVTFSLPDWRVHVILYAVIGSAIAQALLLYIEPRHSLFAYAAYPIYVGMTLDKFINCKRPSTVLLGGVLIIGIVLLYFAPLPDFILKSTLPAMLAGQTKDVLLLLAILALIPLQWALLASPHTRWQRLQVVVLPVLFALITGGHLLANSNLRWQAWHADASVFPHGIQQTIHLAQPITEQLEGTDRVAWVVLDVKSIPNIDTVRLSINGQPVEGARWERWFCTEAGVWCSIYNQIAQMSGKSLDDFPQWVGIPIDITTIENARAITIEIAELDDLAIGGTYTHQPSLYRGASVNGWESNGFTSIYRLGVLEDWRITRNNRLESVQVESYYNDAQGNRHPMSGTFSIHLVILENGVFLRYY